MKRNRLHLLTALLNWRKSVSAFLSRMVVDCREHVVHPLSRMV